MNGLHCLQGDLTKQEFLQGHNNRVSCVTVSRSGKFLASGQVSPMGFSAPIIVWDFAGRKIVHRLVLHKVTLNLPSSIPPFATT